jgi:transcriptional regulator with XRE-family HTH domain
MDVKSKFGKRVRELRLSSGYSQEAFSLQCGLDRTYIASLENGKRNISLQNIERIACAFNLSLSDFFSSEIFEVYEH